MFDECAEKLPTVRPVLHHIGGLGITQQPRKACHLAGDVGSRRCPVDGGYSSRGTSGLFTTSQVGAAGLLVTLR